MLVRAFTFPLLLSVALASDQSSDSAPISLSGGIANTFLRTYRIEMRDGALLYYNGEWGDQNVQPERIKPTREQWKAFRKALDQSRVWQWRKSYDAAVLDGTAWELKIHYSDRQLDSGGFNGFPPSFERVAAAVERLLGGEPFRADQP